jgi:hypothetical protein
MSYILPNLGIPAEIDMNFGWGVLHGVAYSGRSDFGLNLMFHSGFAYE